MEGKPLGDPGEADYSRGSVQGEVKDWADKVGKNDLMEEIQKGRNEIVSRQGFTDEAVEYRDRYQSKVKLFDWKRKRSV